MNRKWVGSLVTIALTLCMLGTAVSAPSQTQGDTFERPDSSRWDLVRGNLSFENEQGPTNQTLTWMVLGDDDDATGTGPSRVRVNATHVTDGNLTWNTTSGSYYYSATLEEHQPYTSPSEGTVTSTNTSAAGTTTSEGTLNVTLAANATSGVAPLAVGFTIGSNESSAAFIDWQFDADGDGITDASGQGLPATVNHTYTTVGSYSATLNATLVNDTANLTMLIMATEAPLPSGPALDGALGITFGETDGGGYYVAAFTNDRFFLGIPNATSGAFDILVDQADWGDVDPRKQDIDIRHRYSIEVDGTTVLVKVDNAKVGTYALPGVPRGMFGVIADEDMRVNVGEVYWQTLDRIQPTVDIFRPQGGAIYVHDTGITHAAGTGLPPIVEGPLTIGVDAADNVGGVGLKSATIMVDGKTVAYTRSPGLDTQLQIETGHLSPGFHTVSVRVFDLQGNMGTDSVQIFVISAQMPTGDTIDSGAGLVEETLGQLPPL